MPNRLRSIVLALVLTAAAAVAAGCGGNSGPDPSIDKGDATALLGKLQEIRANVDVDSPCVAQDRTGDLISDIQSLPSSVNSDVQRALEDGANNLQNLLNTECEARTTTTQPTTTEPTTTQETTTQRTQPTTTERTQTETTPTQTQTTPTQPTTPGGSGGGGGGGGGASGGIGPGGL